MIITKDEIKSWIERWAAPYSPFNPVDVEDIYAEQKQLVEKLSEVHLPVLLEIYREMDRSEANEGAIINIWGLTHLYQQKISPEFVATELFPLLREDGPIEVIWLIGSLDGQKAYSAQMIHKIKYNLLTIEAKIEFLDALENLRDKDCLKYLSEIEATEDNSVVLKRIEEAKKFFHSI